MTWLWRVFQVWLVVIAFVAVGAAFVGGVMGCAALVRWNPWVGWSTVVALGSVIAALLLEDS